MCGVLGHGELNGGNRRTDTITEKGASGLGATPFGSPRERGVWVGSGGVTDKNPH